MIHISSEFWKKSGLDSNQITELVTVFYSKQFDDAFQNVLQGEDYYIARYMERSHVCQKSKGGATNARLCIPPSSSMN